MFLTQEKKAPKCRLCDDDFPISQKKNFFLVCHKSLFSVDDKGGRRAKKNMIAATKLSHLLLPSLHVFGIHQVWRRARVNGKCV